MVTVAYFCCLTLGVHGSETWGRVALPLTPHPSPARRGGRWVSAAADGVRAQLQASPEGADYQSPGQRPGYEEPTLFGRKPCKGEIAL